MYFLPFIYQDPVDEVAKSKRVIRDLQNQAEFYRDKLERKEIDDEKKKKKMTVLAYTLMETGQKNKAGSKGIRCFLNQATGFLRSFNITLLLYYHLAGLDHTNLSTPIKNQPYHLSTQLNYTKNGVPTAL